MTHSVDPLLVILTARVMPNAQALTLCAVEYDLATRMMREWTSGGRPTHRSRSDAPGSRLRRWVCWGIEA